jgi:hypothetical protein
MEALPLKSRIVLVLVMASGMSGCYAVGRFYPVQGPLSAQAPVPVYRAKLTGGFNSGNITVDLGGGEVCSGHWATGQTEPPTTGSNPSGGPAANSMPAVWDAVYGQGFYTSQVLGAKLFARAQASCKSGTVLNVEMYKRETGHPEANVETKGVAKDNKENIYKVVF